MLQSISALRRDTKINLQTAVHRNSGLSKEGMLERLFTAAFRHLVYAQIWEDPVVDMEALKIGPSDHIVAIASGGCNVMSYLVANPARITAVDLNGAHVALNCLKIEAAQCLPDHGTFFNMFGRADKAANVVFYDQFVAPRLDPTSRRYWEGRTATGRRRIEWFAHGVHRHGLLGRFIGAGHRIAKLNGCDPAIMLQARTIGEQRALFDKHLAPLFAKRMIRFLASQPASLYGLGIPPAQYRALAGDSAEGIIAVLRQRLEKLACGFELKDNYFAWQAFGRKYDPAPDASTPPYLEAGNFDAVSANAGRIDVRHESMTAFLRASPAASADCYVLLDAQDWMNDADLTTLWSEITRTARPGARVIFRTAADERLLPGRIPDATLTRWRYHEEVSRDLGRRDRSSIYGAFHLYTLEGA